MSAGILLIGQDEVIESRARRYKVALVARSGEHPYGAERRPQPETMLPFERTLITVPGTRIPWELLGAAWGLLERWDAAVPFWQYTETAVSVGTEAERELTRAVVRDLRVLLHATELLFVRRSEAGAALVETWLTETGLGSSITSAGARLAFLRALYQVKPKLCVLPTSWLGGGRVIVSALPRRPIHGDNPLVKVELQPGRFVKCHRGDEQTVKAFMDDVGGRRIVRRKIMATVSKQSFVTDNQKTRAGKGPLVRIEMQPGRFVKMYREDAIAAGYINVAPEPVKKGRPAQEDKRRPPQKDKSQGDEEMKSEATPADDFTTIDGVGRATDRLLKAHGIMTFDQLREADLSFLSNQQMQAIAEWR